MRWATGSGRPAPGGGGGGGGRARPPARAAPGGTTRDVEHRALEPDEQTQQLCEGGGVQGARGAVRRRVHREHVAYPRDGHLTLTLELSAEHRARRAPGDTRTKS